MKNELYTLDQMPERNPNSIMLKRDERDRELEPFDLFEDDKVFKILHTGRALRSYVIYINRLPYTDIEKDFLDSVTEYYQTYVFATITLMWEDSDGDEHYIDLDYIGG